MLALDDVRILDLSRLLPGAFCTLLLADCGADVIKVEDTDSGDYLRWMPPMAGEYSALFAPYNRNKRSIKLNLKTDGGRDAFMRLVRDADVVVESFRPGVMARLGIDYEALRAVNPGIILGSISGYGQDGPYRERAGHDLNYAAIAGVLGLGGGPGGAPAMPGVQAGDLGGGALQAALAIMVALHQRARTGTGQHCDIAMTDGLISWIAPHAAAFFAGEPAPGPGTLLLNGRYPCYRIYACADGHVAVGALEPKFWRNLVDALGLPQHADAQFADGEEGRRVSDDVAATLARRTRAEWVTLFDGRDVCCEPLLRVDEVFENPQVRHRGMRLDPGVGGPLAQPGFPLHFSDLPMRVRRPAPGYGEHTDEVLGDAGFSAADIASLRAEGATA